jgi:hypothetical protein
VRVRLPPPSKNLLRDLAREFDGYLRQSETSSLEPWQQEIRDYLRSGRMPTLFARNNLAVWGRRRGLMTQAPGSPQPLATGSTQHYTKSRPGAVLSKPSETGLKNR